MSRMRARFFLVSSLIVGLMLETTGPGWCGPPLPPPRSDAVSPTVHPRTNLKQAWQALHASDPETALAIVERVLSFDPGRTEALLLKAVVLRTLGRDADALTAADAAVKGAPQNALAQRTLASVLLDEQRASEARQAAQRAVDIAPGNAACQNILGMTLRAEASTPLPIGQPTTEAQAERQFARNSLLEDAIRAFQTACQERPGFVDAWLDLGLTYADMGRASQATRALQRALSLDPNCAGAHVALGVLRLHQRDESGAERQFDDALRINPNLPAALVDLGSIRYRQHRTEEALKLAQHALQFEAANAPALVLRGTIRRDAGQYSDASQDLELAVTVAPNNASAHAALGTLLLDEGDAEHACAELLKATWCGLDDAAVENNLGLTYKLLAQYKRARVHFDKALALAPASPEIHYNMAVMLSMAGDRAGAAENFEAYLKLSPDAADAPQVRERVQELLHPQTK